MPWREERRTGGRTGSVERLLPRGHVHQRPPVLGTRFRDVARYTFANYRSTPTCCITALFAHIYLYIYIYIYVYICIYTLTHKSHGRKSTDLKAFFISLHLPTSTCNLRHLWPVGVCSTPFLTLTPDNSSFHRRRCKSMFWIPPKPMLLNINAIDVRIWIPLLVVNNIKLIQ